MGLLSDAVANGQTKTVGINQHDWTIFYSNNHLKAIGVKGLSACSVIAIVSPHAAAVAHIGPNILGSSNPNSFIELAQNLTRETVSICTANPTLFPRESKTHIICATVNNNLITAPEQVRAMYQGAKKLPHSNVQWHYYEQSDPTSIDPQTHLGTVFVDGRHGTPRVYVEDRDVTDAAGNSLMWIYNGRYQLKLATVILEETLNPPLHTWVYVNGKWSKWDGYNWLTQ
jgi:hypothetical protein